MTDKTVTTINLTPTAEEYERIAERFTLQLMNDIRVKRRTADAHILYSLVEIIYYMGATRCDDLKTRYLGYLSHWKDAQS